MVAREENEGPRFLAWSPGGENCTYRGRVSGGRDWAVIERDLASGKERELIRKPFVGAFYLSPDGRFIAAGMSDSKSEAAVLIPIAGGEPRELIRVDQLGPVLGFSAGSSPSPDGLPIAVQSSSESCRPAGNRRSVWFLWTVTSGSST